MVRELAAALRVNGLQKGDRVAAVITNSIDAVVIALAASSIGAVFSSTATDMGVSVSFALPTTAILANHCAGHIR
jgi:acetoacetyl-CoA synthetase